MKVILLEDVKSLGKAGEVKEVKDGYGNNFIIKNKLGIIATKENMRKLQAKEERQKAKEEVFLQDLKKQKEKIDSHSFKIVHKLGQTGSLYGAITKSEIAECLHKEKIEIDKKNIDIKNPIKTSGVHEIPVKLGHGINAIMKLEIIGQ